MPCFHYVFRISFVSLRFGWRSFNCVIPLHSLMALNWRINTTSCLTHCTLSIDVTVVYGNVHSWFSFACFLEIPLKFAIIWVETWLWWMNVTALSEGDWLFIYLELLPNVGCSNYQFLCPQVTEAANWEPSCPMWMSLVCGRWAQWLRIN